MGKFTAHNVYNDLVDVVTPINIFSWGNAKIDILVAVGTGFTKYQVTDRYNDQQIVFDNLVDAVYFAEEIQ